MTKSRTTVRAAEMISGSFSHGETYGDWQWIETRHLYGALSFFVKARAHVRTIKQDYACDEYYDRIKLRLPSNASAELQLITGCFKSVNVDVQIERQPNFDLDQIPYQSWYDSVAFTGVWSELAAYMVDTAGNLIPLAQTLEKRWASGYEEDYIGPEAPSILEQIKGKTYDHLLVVYDHNQEGILITIV